MEHNNIAGLVEASMPASEEPKRDSSRRLKPPMVPCHGCREEIPGNQGEYHQGKLYCKDCYAAAKADEPKAAETNTT